MLVLGVAQYLPVLGIIGDIFIGCHMIPNTDTAQTF